MRLDVIENRRYSLDSDLKNGDKDFSHGTFTTCTNMDMNWNIYKTIED